MITHHSIANQDYEIINSNYLTNKVRLALIFSLFLTISYTIILPSGEKGIYLTLASLFVGCLAFNGATLATYLLLFGPSVFGVIAVVLNLSGYGGKISILASLLLIIILYPRFLFQIIEQLRYTLIWLAWCAFILLVWYYQGPQTDYSKELLLGFLLNTPVLILGFSFLFWNRDINWLALGTIVVVSAYSIIAFGSSIDPRILPNGLFDVSAIRNPLNQPYFSLSVHDLSYIAGMGAIISLSSWPIHLNDKSAKLILLLSIILAVVVLGWAFNRAVLLAFTLTILVSIIIIKLKKSQYMTLAFIVIALILYAFYTAYQLHNPFVEQMLDHNKSFSARINRSTNWDAALYSIKENPLLGKGLGGYSIPGHALSGEKIYAHNFVLGMLTDLGAGGTLLLFFPLMIRGLKRIRENISLMLDSLNYSLILLVVIFTCVSQFATGDLTKHAVYFSLLAIFFGTWKK
jgi:O-antigen ligase